MQRIAYRARIDPLRVAFFVAYWRKKESESGQILMPSTYSELISKGFEDYIDKLISIYPEIFKEMENLTTMEDVLAFLRNQGFHAPQEEGYRRSVLRALQEEHLQSDFDTTKEDYIAEDRKEKSRFTKEETDRVEEAVELYKESLEEKRLDPEKEKEKALKSWKEQGVSFEEKEARKAAEQKKAFDEVLGSTKKTETKEKGDEDK